MSTNLLQIPRKLSGTKLTTPILLFNNRINTLQIKADISPVRDNSLQKYLSNLISHFENLFTAVIPSIKRLHHAR